MSAADLTPGQEKAFRRLIREEFERIVPELRHGQAYLTVRETATRYRLGYDTVKEKIERGELLTVKRPYGRKRQLLVVAADAESKLGPGVVP